LEASPSIAAVAAVVGGGAAAAGLGAGIATGLRAIAAASMSDRERNYPELSPDGVLVRCDPPAWPASYAWAASQCDAAPRLSALRWTGFRDALMKKEVPHGCYIDRRGLLSSAAVAVVAERSVDAIFVSCLKLFA
jgi:hypothetical protein